MHAAAPPPRPRVASVPSAHPYVEHLGADVERLPDPPVPGAEPGQWWPPGVLDAEWIAAHAGRFDLVHVHFGLESLPLERLEDAFAALRAAGRPLVHTVHDLENPQLADQAGHTARLDVVIAAADALLTLTPGAAAEVARRWGREATVVPHPHLHPFDAPLPAGRRQEALQVGVHLRGLRPGIDGPQTTAAVLGAARMLRAAGRSLAVRVELGDRVRDVGARDEVRALCAGEPGVTLVELPRQTDGELAAALADLDVVVLPYTHGTHSGWLELCWDLGATVAAPDVGHVLEQHEDGSVAAFARGDAAALAAALEQLAAAGAHARPGSAGRLALQHERRAQRREAAIDIAAAHDAVYRRVLSRHRP